MTRGALLAHDVKHGVAVAVERDRADVLHVPARVALHPERLPASGPVGPAPGPLRLPKRVRVRPGEHEDRAVLVLRDDRNEPALVELHAREELLKRARLERPHGLTSKPFARRNAFASPTVCFPSWKIDAASAASA
jgi:hypothetical protein